MDLFSQNYAESGNTNQLLSVPGDEPFAEERNTDGCFLFLPAAGNSNGSSINNTGNNGNYWSSTPNSGNSNNSWNANFNSGNLNPNNNNRNNGFSVRCVLESTNAGVSFPIFHITKEQLGLTLHPKKSKIVRCCYGIDFLGVFVKPHRRYINNRTKKRIFRKSVPLFNCTDTEKLRAGINSYLGYMKHFKCGKIKERLFGGKPQLELLGEFIGHYSKFSLPQLELKRTGS